VSERGRQHDLAAARASGSCTKVADARQRRADAVADGGPARLRGAWARRQPVLLSSARLAGPTTCERGHRVTAATRRPPLSGSGPRASRGSPCGLPLASCWSASRRLPPFAAHRGGAGAADSARAAMPMVSGAWRLGSGRGLRALYGTVYRLRADSTSALGAPMRARSLLLEPGDSPRCRQSLVTAAAAAAAQVAEAAASRPATPAVGWLAASRRAASVARARVDSWIRPTPAQKALPAWSMRLAVACRVWSRPRRSPCARSAGGSRSPAAPIS
jgi:hypothetical protein